MLRGTPPFCSLLTSQVVARSHNGPRCARVLRGAPGGLASVGTTGSVRHPAAPSPHLGGVGVGIAPHGPNQAPPHDHQESTLGSAVWGAVPWRRFRRGSPVSLCALHGESRVHVRGRPLHVQRAGLGRRDVGSRGLLRATQEPRRPVDGNHCRVLLVTWEQAYANRGSQVDQVVSADDAPGAAAPPQPGAALWGLHGRGPEQGPPPCHVGQGVTRR